jgi:hypothetical protein
MLRLTLKSGAVSARLNSGIIAAVFALGVGASGQVLAASVTEVDLATSAQALTYCQSGALAKGSVAYFNGTVQAQFGPKQCLQKTPMKTVKDALAVSGATVSECTLATAKEAITLCNAGGINTYDIAYVKGPAGTVIGGPGYGCTTNITNLSIGNAVCK